MGHASHEDMGEDDYEELARELMRRGFQLARLRPAHELESSSRGLPAVLQSLARADGPLSPGEIARATHVTDARVANALRVLESRGLVERRASSRDRRRVEVSLTERGREDIRSRDREGVRCMVSFLRDLGADDARDLARLLGRVVEVVERRRAEGVDFGSCAPCKGLRPDRAADGRDPGSAEVGMGAEPAGVGPEPAGMGAEPAGVGPESAGTGEAPSGTGPESSNADAGQGSAGEWRA